MEIPLSNNYGNLYFPSYNIITDKNDDLSWCSLTFNEATERDFNLYAIWDRYVWTVEGAIIGVSKCIQGVVHATKQRQMANNRSNKDELGFYSTESENSTIDPYNGSTAELNDQTIVPNFPVKWTFGTEMNYGLSSITLNGVPFAGTDITEDYWNQNRNTLYKDIPESLSVNYVWYNALENDGGFPTIMIYLPSVTSSHVKDNKLNFEFKTYALNGGINLYNSYDEAKTFMN